jgi:hypothetical protein
MINFTTLHLIFLFVAGNLFLVLRLFFVAELKGLIRNIKRVLVNIPCGIKEVIECYLSIFATSGDIFVVLLD